MSTSSGPGATRTIQATEFKAKCLKLMDEVADGGGEIVITKNGRPVAKLSPYRERTGAPFGRDRHIIQIHGDLDEPIDVEWEAMVDPNRVLDPC